MLSITLIIDDPNYYRLTKYTQKIIDQAIGKLIARLEQYSWRTLDLASIFNDDILIHDIVCKHYYVYKCRIHKIQIRLLYTKINNDLIIVSHYIKSNGDSSTAYMPYFERMAAAYDDINKH